MNGSDECESLIKDVEWTDSISLLVLAILLLINIMVVVGNCLVIAAVYISSKLRTVTNLFIVSLAVADLMVGVAVLPFSATWEVFKVWIFGDLWCSIWLAVDVWMCTASILNLCAISLDRYVAVTRPVNYPSIMSSTRAKILIAGVWILSFVICFPPLVGWKDSKTANDTRQLTYGIRVRGTHTVITEMKIVNDTANLNNLTDYEDVVSYQTNYSEHFLVTNFHYTGGDRSSDDVLFMPGKRFEIRHEKMRREKERKMRLMTRSVDGSGRAMLPLSGLPVVSYNEYLMRPREPEGRIPTPQTTTASPARTVVDCPWTCELTSDTGYVIYSALGSFFIPMGVMLFFYWKIYRAAVQTTRAINQGFRTTKGSGAFGNRFDEQRLTLRIHRGRGSVQNHNSTCSSNTASTNEGNCSVSASPSTNSTFGKSPETQRLNRTRSSKDHSKSHEKIKISVSYPSSDQISASAVSSNNGTTIMQESTPESSKRSNSSTVDSTPTTPEGKTYLTTVPSLRRSSLASPKKTTFSISPPKKQFLQNHFSGKVLGSSPKETTYCVHYSSKNDSTTTNLCKSREPNCYLRVTGARLTGSRGGHRSLSIDSTNSSHDDDGSRRNSMKSQLDEMGKDLSPSPTFDEGAHKPKLTPKTGKKNIKAQVKRFKMETKAAKTLGIIVGGFILCWMPFFTIYLVRAFCPSCINSIVFSVLFWLGYCNSAINPCIYALFSNDFRFAFKKIICRYLCGAEKQATLNTKRLGSHFKSAGHDRQRRPSYLTPNCLGDDSDLGGSESR